MTDDEITERLFISENPVSADLAMVFGAANELDLERRTRRGVELYKAGFVPKILVTGGGVLASTCPEARRMAEVAHELGVPAPDLMAEDRSSNTFDNVRFSVEVLNECGLLQELKSILLVSSEWHMRRVLLTARRYLPRRVRLVCCPTCEGCNRDNWTETEDYRREVQQEEMLLEAFLETGALRWEGGE